MICLSSIYNDENCGVFPEATWICVVLSKGWEFYPNLTELPNSFFFIYIQRTKIILLSTKNCLSACKVLIVVFLFSRTGLIHFDLVCLRNWQNWWKFARHILLKMIWLKTLLLAYHQLMHCSSGRVFYFVFQWFNNHLSFIFIAMVTPTLCSPQKIKFGGFKCNLIWKTWSEHFSFHGDDSSQSAVDFTITNCLHKFKSKT